MCAVKNTPVRENYITEDEREKCRKVADVFAELEQDGIVVVDAGRFGFVKLQYYMPSKGFENDYTFTDSKELFEDLWEEWLHTQLIASAKEMGIGDIDYDNVFGKLSEEKQKELIGQRKYFAERAGIEVQQTERNNSKCG